MKFFRPKFLTALLFLFFAAHVQADHLLGGYLSYTHLSGTTYQIKLTVYRDCNSSTLFDGDANSPISHAAIGVFQSNGQTLGTYGLFNPIISSIPAFYDSSCSNHNTHYCIEKAVYIDTINFFSFSDTIAYTIVYQRCCLSSSVININNIADVGETFSATIPPTNLFVNSSPTFDNFPSVLYYVNFPLTYLVLASDADGDSLEYALCAPYEGANGSDPSPPPFPPPYVNMSWAPPYTINNLMGGIPLAIDSLAGIITATPNTIGSFVVGVRVKEFRSGQLINTSIINLMFNIDHCVAPSSIASASGLGFTLYPNPATDELTITTENRTPVDIYIYDMLGNCVLSHKNFSGNMISLKVNHLPPGYYLLKLTDQHGLSSSKGFIIAR